MTKNIVPFWAFDNFSRASSSGWGTSTSGKLWSSNRNSYSVDSQLAVGVIESAESGSKPSTLVAINTLSGTSEFSNQSILFSFMLKDALSNFGPVLLHKDNKNYLFLEITEEGVSLKKVLNNTRTKIKPKGSSLEEVPFALKKNELYWFYAEYKSSQDTLSFKIWKEAEPEKPTAEYTSIGKDFGSKGSLGFAHLLTRRFKIHVNSVFVYSGDLPTHDSSGWSPDVRSLREHPIDDLFSRRDQDGWGSSSTDAFWYGSVIQNPYVKKSGIGYVSDKGAFIEFQEAYGKNGGFWAFLGNYKTEQAPLEVLARFKISSINGSAILRVGPRGRAGINDGDISGAGMAVQIPLRQSSNISIVRKTALTSTWSDFSSFTASGGDVFSLPNYKFDINKTYNVRVHITRNGDNGYFFRGKIWSTDEAEPSTYSLKFSSQESATIDKGAPFINVSSSGADSVNITYFSTSNSITPDSYTLPPRTISFEPNLILFNNVTSTSFAPVAKYIGVVTSNTVASIRVYEAANPTLSLVFSSNIPNKVNIRAGEFDLVQGSVTGLKPNTTYRVEAHMEEAGFDRRTLSAEVTTKYDGVFVDDHKVTNISDNSFSLQTSIKDNVSLSSFQDTTASVIYRRHSLVTTEQWSSPVQMTKISSLPYRFEKTIEGLLNDTEYEYKVILEDPDGVNIDPDISLSGIFKTFGNQPIMAWDDNGVLRPSPIEIIADPTTARVIIHYKWDVSNQINFAISYREVGSDKWSDYSFRYQNDSRSFIKKVSSKTNKYWEARLFGLTPGIEYEVTVNVIHPNGTYDGITRFQRRFTTRRADMVLSKRTKHYVFKVYDRLGNFISTWSDAGEPKFGIHENGGVSDLTVKLPRLASDLSRDLSLNLGNRVDIWVVDHTSDGIGRNMVIDSDFDLGGWTTSSEWSVSPDSGVDGGAALKVVSNSNSDYALSDFIDTASNGNSTNKYKVVVNISKILQSFEDDIKKSSGAYSAVSDRIEQKLKDLFPGSFNIQSKNYIVLNPQIDLITNPSYGLIKQAGDENNFKLFDNVNLTFGASDLNEVEYIKESIEFLGGEVIINEEAEADSVPYVLLLAANALKGQITAQIEYIDAVNPSTGLVDTTYSTESVSTYGAGWQILKLVFTPPTGARNLRIRITSQGDSLGYIDKVQLLPQELLIYRGRIETLKTEITDKQESITVEVMGLVSQLTDFYIKFKQWVERQPSQDQPKLIDTSIPEDVSPPLTYVTETNLIKPRESTTNPANKHSILFPEITNTDAKIRVYYDGDDNRNATCSLYYTANINTVFNEFPFVSVTAGMTVYAMQDTYLYSSVPDNDDPKESFTSTPLIPSGSPLQVVSSTIKSSDKRVYSYAEVLYNGAQGYVRFEEITNIFGSLYGGVRVVTMTRSER